MDLEKDAPAIDPTRDLQRVDAAAWPERAFPTIDGRQLNHVPIVIAQSALNALHRHAQERTDVEICGVLVGNGYRDAQGPFVLVNGAIRGNHAESQKAQVTFTNETWNHIRDALERDFPEQRILAWYHTHPGFGIFLSGMDIFIHDNFFSGCEQFAVVYDPLSGNEGLFVWSEGKPVKTTFLIVPNAEEDPSQYPPSTARPKQAGLAMTAGAVDRGQQSSDDPARQPAERSITPYLLVVVLIALAWPWLLYDYVVRPQIRELNQRVEQLEIELQELSHPRAAADEPLT